MLHVSPECSLSLILTDSGRTPEHLFGWCMSVVQAKGCRNCAARHVHITEEERRASVSNCAGSGKPGQYGLSLARTGPCVGGKNAGAKVQRWSRSVDWPTRGGGWSTDPTFGPDRSTQPWPSQPCTGLWDFCELFLLAWLQEAPQRQLGLTPR